MLHEPMPVAERSRLNADLSKPNAHDVRNAADSIIEAAKNIFRHEALAMDAVATRLNKNFTRALEVIIKHPGKIIICGVGKSGHVAQKMAATFCSTGTPAIAMHPGEAVHGDLGIYQPGDPTILLSKSGSTAEMLRLIPTLRQFRSPLISIVGNMDSPIAHQSDVVLDVTVQKEADPLGIVPTTSCLVSMAMGDALASCLMSIRNFNEKDFARFHPAGQLGRNLLLTVEDVMHKKIAKVLPDASLRDVVIAMTNISLGGACVIDESDKLLGIVTDGDIRRILQQEEDVFKLKAIDIMTANPMVVSPHFTLNQAVKIMEDRPSQISVLPVVNSQNGRCLGLLRIHDIYQPELG